MSIHLYIIDMQFTWDENKRLKNIQKHGIDFLDLTEVFEKPMLTRIDDRKDYGEARWIALGELDGNVVVLVYTERSDTTRIISARRATKNEANIYFKKISHY